MTTYLILTNKVLEALNEVTLSTDGSNFTSSRGIQSAVKSFVNKSINDIYNAELQWPYLHSDTTQATTAGTAEYSLPSDYRHVDYDTFILQPTQLVSTNTFSADSGKVVPCPPINPEYPIGSVGKYGRATVTGWTRDLVTGECLTLWEPIPILETVEAYIPPPTLVAGVFATALFGASGALFASPLVKLLNKTTKPLKKKIVAAVKKKLGKTEKKLSVKERQDLQREKKEISLLWRSLKK